MAVLQKNKRTAYDNIAVGSATGKERTISGSLPPAVPTTAYGGLDNIAVGTTDIGIENIVAGTDPPTSENVDLSSGGTT